MDRDTSLVLAIDAKYGEGKTWFLKNLTRQINVKHPVAYIDAWIDDANNEPAVAILHALNEALSEYLTPGSKIADRFSEAWRAALPIIGKAAVGGATKFAQRYLGDSILLVADDELRKASRDRLAGENSVVEEVFESSADKANDAVSKLIDKRAEQLVDEFHRRRTSRVVFKDKMAAIIDSIHSERYRRAPPLVVIVDELDRCRPDYAIKLLEEIKHFFDVPGIAFVIAIHSDQLSAAINAIYEPEFDSSDYLRRFFSKRYEMRPLSVREIVREEYNRAKLQDNRFTSPMVLTGQSDFRKLPPVELLGEMLDDLSVTPRETFPVIDNIRLFHDQWNSKASIELTALVPMVVNSVRNQPILSSPKGKGSLKFMGRQTGYQQGVSSENFTDVAGAMFSLMNNDLERLAKQPTGGSHGVASQRFVDEIQARFPRGYQSNNPPLSLVNKYAEIVRLLSRFTDDLGDP